MINLHIEDKCFACPRPELQIEKLAYKTCTGKTNIHVHNYVVVCDYSEGGCGASTGGSARTKETAIKAWNRRYGDGNG